MFPVRITETEKYIAKITLVPTGTDDYGDEIEGHLGNSGSRMTNMVSRLKDGPTFQPNVMSS